MSSRTLNPGFIGRQVRDLAGGGAPAFRRKLGAARLRLAALVMMPPALVAVLAMRAIRPLLLVRLHPLFASRIGHFASNTELYLCERDRGLNVPAGRYVDIAFLAGPVSNRQLAVMWRRVLRVWPAWIVEPVLDMNRRVPGGSAHEVGANAQHDRDIHGLYDQCPPHLSFTAEEHERGQRGLEALGVPRGAAFVCVIGRDASYLQRQGGAYGYHDYRNVDIRNYERAAEALAGRGLFVLRMGSVVADPLVSAHPRVIDYATSAHRSDFLDVYIAAHCRFFVSCSTGLDAVAQIFRRPIAYVNMVPAGYWMSFLDRSLVIFKHHCDATGAPLPLREIAGRGVAYALDGAAYDAAGIELRDNTPEEIEALVVEMHERLQQTWREHPGDADLQRRFLSVYPSDATGSNGRPLHGTIRSRHGASFLRDNQAWLN